LLLFAPGLEFVTAFFGALYAGLVAVPMYPPTPGRPESALPRLLRVVENAQPRAVLTTSSMIAMAAPIAAFGTQFGDLRWTAVDAVDISTADAWVPAPVSPDTTALIQYTSGSTSNPRGVVICHANLLLNIEQMRTMVRGRRPERLVSWLPLYHDMGLIGIVCANVDEGSQAILMSPLSFLRSPVSWLRAISKFGASLSVAPNFAYDLCSRSITDQQKQGLDLSGWSVAIVGSDPIRAATLERFTAAFAACGFRREAFIATYGLAEATLIVSASTPSPQVIEVSKVRLERQQAMAPETPYDGQSLVCCGRAVPPGQITIVRDEDRMPCRDNEVGEIWLAGGSIAAGYWNQASETDRCFGAHLADGRGPYLRTGDLGFLRDGELYITGRLKEAMIFYGRKLYPQDIEWTVETTSPNIRPGCTAVFSVEIDGQERLIVAAELEHRGTAGHAPSQSSDHSSTELPDRVERDPQRLRGTLRAAIAAVHQIQIHDIVFLRRGALPKTSSGKLQRIASRQAYLDGTLARLSA
jgi:acyl-CoA synthetase (AMP-forming)/AMP-acid ligase II